MLPAAHLVFSILVNVLVLVGVRGLRSAPPRLVVGTCLLGMSAVAVPWSMLGTWLLSVGMPGGLGYLAVGPGFVSVAARPDPASPASWMEILIALWLTVGAVWLTVTWASALRLRRCWRARALPGGGLRELAARPLEALAEKVEIHRVPESRMVLATGLWRREIWIGSGITDERHVAAALNHELSHLAAGDHYLVHLIAALERLVWWNPLIWMLGRIARRHLEYDCDQRCRRLPGGDRYRSVLAEMALERVPAGIAGALAMRDASGMIERMERLGMTHRMKLTHGAGLAASAALIALCTTALAADDEQRTLLACNEFLPEGVHYRMEIKSNLDTRSESSDGSIAVTLLDEQKPGSVEVPEGSAPYVRCVLDLLGVPKHEYPPDL